MDLILFDSIVFGPVYSRRLGISLGINLLPVSSKWCNFNCIYCECGWTPNRSTKVVYHPRKIIRDELEERLRQLILNSKPLDAITFAGNGEPTMHPEFAGIIDDTLELRDIYFPGITVAVLSNATLIAKPQVFNALNKVDQNILKLDSAFEETIKLLNCPTGEFNLPGLIESLKQFKGNLIIQTMFVKGQYNNQLIDNTSDKEVNAWIGVLKEIHPANVMIYSIARNTPVKDLIRISDEKLNEIADLAKANGLKVQVF